MPTAVKPVLASRIGAAAIITTTPPVTHMAPKLPAPDRRVSARDRLARRAALELFELLLRHAHRPQAMREGRRKDDVTIRETLALERRRRERDAHLHLTVARLSPAVELG